MKLVVLGNDTLAVLVGEPTMAEADLFHMSNQIEAALTGWRVLVFDSDGEVVDLRGDAEAKRLAEDLLARIEAAGIGT